MLYVNGLSVNYGVIRAVKKVSFVVNKGEIVSLIGANGAGKTTIMKALAKLLPLSDGAVSFGEHDLSLVPAHNVVSLGMALVPEGRQVFSSMTVEENLRLGGYSVRERHSSELSRVYGLFPRLRERRRQPAGTLSGGEQQMLAVGRALMSKPELLLIDELSMGLSPLLSKELMKSVQSLNADGMTILLVEQNAKAALSVSDRAYVLETGSIVLEGKGKDLLGNEQVRKSYLGG